MKRNFLFDLYGTLADIRTDEESDEFWAAVAPIFGSRDGETLKNAYRTLCTAASKSPEEEIELTNVFRRLLSDGNATLSPEVAARAFREASTRKLRLFDGAAEILEGLHSRGAKVYLLSNAQACFTRRELETLGLSEKFDGIVLSSEVGWKKPSERFFRAAFELFHLLPQDCIYIGNDFRDDVEGARNAGMRSVYIQTEQSGKYEKTIPVDMFATDHRALKELLFRLAEQ